MIDNMLYWYLLILVLVAGLLTINISLVRPLLPHKKIASHSCPQLYVDYQGIMHCHTVYSDGAASFEELISVTNQLGLDFLLTSDHNTIQPKIDGWEGWHGKTLLLVGEERSTDAGHLLVFNVDEKVPVKKAQEAIHFANARGGLTFLAHPDNLKVPWYNWDVQHYTGLEIINFDSVCRRKAIQVTGVFSLLAFLFSPRYLGHVVINNTPYKEMKRWDQLTTQRKVVGIGGTDTHGFLKVGKKKYRLPSYHHSFQTVYTHLVLPQPFSQDAEIDKKMVYQALAKGNAYFSFESLVPSRGFQFFAYNGRDSVIMGDDVSLLSNEPVTLTAILPSGQEGIIQILVDGAVIASSVGSQLTIQVNKPGAYRVMVFHYQARLPFYFFYRKKFWIGSNPIYIHGKPA